VMHLVLLGFRSGGPQRVCLDLSLDRERSPWLQLPFSGPVLMECWLTGRKMQPGIRADFGRPELWLLRPHAACPVATSLASSSQNTQAFSRASY
jgi:hypothetical protein